MSSCIPTKSTTERNLCQQTSNPQNNNSSINVTRDILVRIPECMVILMNEGEAGEVAAGYFELQWISDGDVALAAAAKVREELQWPLTKDEPVVKLDALNYDERRPASQLRRGVCGDKWRPLGTVGCVAGEALLVHRRTEQEKCWHRLEEVQEIGETILIPAVGENNADQPEKICDSGANKNKASFVPQQSLDTVCIYIAKKLTKMTYEITKSMVDVIDEASESVREARVASSIEAVQKLLEATEEANKRAMGAKLPSLVGKEGSR
ncbi:hypothetical protein SASPL_117570 [Salvia splendens]|uniref:Uncharacterized protein n=1 Tax=Salvia splendens TaxID=180675 RepID=A0A8X8Y0T5_SALSN|nr:hypothetical protein SASPL_117570 [Salvia splendens]